MSWRQRCYHRVTFIRSTNVSGCRFRDAWERTAGRNSPPAPGRRNFLLTTRCHKLHSTLVIPFRLSAQSGVPVHEQLVQAAKRAIVSGQLRPGEAFPSVRALAAALHIHVNTAQRAVSVLKQEGLIEIQPGIGATVAVPPPSLREERARLIRAELEPLLVEALRLGMSLPEFEALLRVEWSRLRPAGEE